MGRLGYISMNAWVGRLGVVALLAGGMCVSGCTRQDNAKIQQDTAQATQQAKQETQQAAQNTKQALASAEGAVNAAADGLKQGIKAHTGPMGDSSNSSVGKTPAGKIDLNSASHDQLIGLPGISDAKADAISVVAKGILTPTQYHRIALDVAVQ